MSVAIAKQKQGLLFSEPSIAETGVWCQLNEGIDPGEWAYICRYIGRMSPREFGKVKKKIVGRPDSLGSRVGLKGCLISAKVML